VADEAIAEPPVSAADLFRRAAARLLKNAGRASKAPWRLSEDGLVWPDCMGDPVSGSSELENAYYIEMMHPPVGFAIATLLTHAADQFDKHTYMELPECPGCAEPPSCRGHDWVRTCGQCGRDVAVPGDTDPCCCWTDELAVAREVLREPEGGPGCYALTNAGRGLECGIHGKACSFARQAREPEGGETP
jgi:hypothetical protein